MTSREQRAAFAAYAALEEAVILKGCVLLHEPTAPDSPMVNRIVGLGLERPATEADVDEALGAVPEGTSFYVAVTPGAEPAELPIWLAARGLEAGWGWMWFRRGVEPIAPRASELRLERVVPGELADAFGRIVRVGYGLPEPFDAVGARACETGWECWLALDGDEPAGAGGLFALDGVGYLGLAATLPEQRGKGAQGLLLAHRIRRAAELGCDLVVTETGERRDDRPSNSYRNILRAGFEEVAVTANWLGRA
jgi:GNAT superfamily N-acetyltransferase